MTHDEETLITWIKVCLWIAAICATSFPVLYTLSPWYKSRLGRALMLQSVAFATAIDLTLLFQYWAPSDILVLFWINAAVFTFIAVACATLTAMLWHINHATKIEERESHGSRSTRGR